MRPTLTSTLAILAAANQVRADFFVAQVSFTSIGMNSDLDGNPTWILPSAMDCKTASQAGMYNEYSDVSKKNGVRVAMQNGKTNCDKFAGCMQPSEVEIHTDAFHVTWYQNRNNALVDTKGKNMGSCTIDMTTDENCKATAGSTRFQSLLNCKTSLSPNTKKS